MADATTPVDLVLTQLEAADCRPRRSGRGWAARCPAHADSTPSLRLSEGDDRRALLRCYSGCDFRSIVSALGLEPRQLFESNTLEVRAVAPRKLLTPAERVKRDVEKARADGAPIQTWDAWLSIGGTIDEAFASNPVRDARSWITQCIREAQRTLDVDTLGRLFRALGKPFPDGRPGRGARWYALELEALVRDAYWCDDRPALARCLDAIDRVAA